MGQSFAQRIRININLKESIESHNQRETLDVSTLMIPEIVSFFNLFSNPYKLCYIGPMDSTESIKKNALSYVDILIAISIVLFGLYWLMMRDFNSATEKIVVIYKDDVVIRTLPLLKDRIIQLEPFGISMVVEIRDQKVRVLSSSCHQQICVRKGWTGQVNNPIICLPNKITINITGADPVYDAITR